MVKDASPRTHMCNRACTVERSARQWHTDGLLSYHPAYYVWLMRDRLPIDRPEGLWYSAFSEAPGEP